MRRWKKESGSVFRKRERFLPRNRRDREQDPRRIRRDLGRTASSVPIPGGPVQPMSVLHNPTSQPPCPGRHPPLREQHRRAASRRGSMGKKEGEAERWAWRTTGGRASTNRIRWTGRNGRTGTANRTQRTDPRFRTLERREGGRIPHRRIRGMQTPFWSEITFFSSPFSTSLWKDSDVPPVLRSAETLLSVVWKMAGRGTDLRRRSRAGFRRGDPHGPWWVLHSRGGGRETKRG